MATIKPNSVGKAAAKTKTTRKAPAVKTAAAKPMAAPRARKASAGSAAMPVTAPPPQSKLMPEQRYRMVQEAAYLNAEREGFMGDPMAHWLDAERQIRERLGE